MRQLRYNVSLYVIIPIIFAGISLLSSIISYRTAHYYLTGGDKEFSTVVIIVGVFSIISAILGFFLVRLMLGPVKRFIHNASKLSQALVSSETETKVESLDEITKFEMVFDQVTNILSSMDAREYFPEIVGESLAIRSVLTQIRKVAPAGAAVLIFGESGTGKELVATSIYNHSDRNNKPFIKINCAAIPPDLLESELFGHEKGAFTGAVKRKIGKFETADGGTLFLDEIGDMPMDLQSKILRVLQEKEFDRVGGTKPVKVNVRILSATNKNLEQMVKDKKFREDLYYRLNVVSIYLPPLRERGDDILLLAEHFLKNNEKPKNLSHEVVQAFLTYSWPGNIRELQNMIERTTVLCDGNKIETVHLPKALQIDLEKGGMKAVSKAVTKKNLIMEKNAKDEPFFLDEHLKNTEREIIIEALKMSNGVQVKAAALLGINQRSLWNRVKKYNINPKGYKSTKNDD